MGRFRLYTDPPHPSGIRGQDTHVEFIDDKGIRHPIKNYKAAKVLISNRFEPVELHLCLVGQLEIDVEVEVAATMIKDAEKEERFRSPTGRTPHQIPLKKR